MTVAVTLDVPAELYTLLCQQAERIAQTPEEWMLTTLRRQLLQSGQPDQNLRRHFGAVNFGAVNLGAATGTDNEASPIALYSACVL